MYGDPRCIGHDKCGRHQNVTIDLRLMHMEDEEIINPWITVSKRKRNRTFVQNDAVQKGSSKSEVETLQANSFINLSLQESNSEDSTQNGLETTDFTHALLSPGIPSPPRKRCKKGPKKVHSSSRVC